MKILLYDLGTDRNELNEPIGICCLSPLLKNHNVDLYWEKISSPSNYKGYDFIGLSVGLGRYEFFKKQMKIIMKENPTATISVGGITPTFAYERILNEFPMVICIIGEGETATAELVETLKFKQKPSKKIKNLAFIENGNIIETTRYQEDLTSHAGITRHFTNEIVSRQGIARIEGSRGCPWGKCSFCCVEAKYGSSSWRPFPTEHILNELFKLNKQGVTSPYFTDEDFFGEDYTRSIKLAQKIIEQKKNGQLESDMNFFASLRVKDVVGKGITAIREWKKAGLREIFIGVESCSKEQLKRYKKGVSPNDNLKAIKVLQKLGFTVDTGFILFDPKMDYEDLKASVELIEDIHKLGIDSRSIKSLRVQPKTQYYTDILAKGELIPPLDMNTLKYEIAYLDERVFMAKEFYEKYEMLFNEQLYLLQAKSRGEINSEKERIKLKKVIESCRGIDIHALAYLIHQIDISNFNFDWTTFITRKKQLISPFFDC